MRTLLIVAVLFAASVSVVAGESAVNKQYIPIVKTWKCPMASCKITGQAAAGKCPVCGMNLVVESHAEVAAWKCPMAVCKITGQAKLGKCPKCGMNLVPETLGKNLGLIPDPDAPAHNHATHNTAAHDAAAHNAPAHVHDH